MNDKHFAFLLDIPSKGKFMMFPDYFENLSEEDLKGLEEVSEKVEDIRWSAELAKSNYKVFRRLPKQKEPKY